MPEGRYSRIEKLKKIGPDNLLKLQALSVAVIGIGGTGSLLTEMLAGNGIGRITVIDRYYCLKLAVCLQCRGKYPWLTQFHAGIIYDKP